MDNFGSTNEIILKAKSSVDAAQEAPATHFNNKVALMRYLQGKHIYIP